MRVPFAITYGKAEGGYPSQSSELSVQRVLNLYAEEAPENEKTPVSLFPTPGLTAFGSAIDPSTVRGMKQMGGLLYVVAGNTFYRVDAAANAQSIGSVQGDGPVYMETNGTQILIITANDQAYIATNTTIALISDPDFPGARSGCFIDGYFIVGLPGTDQFNISAINDGTQWDALDFASAEADPDTTVRVFADHRELWLFGEKTTEIFYNSGDATFPFQRVSGAIITRGCGAARSVAAMDNSIFWLGDDGIVYRANGYTPVRVSTHAIEQLISTMPNKADARAFSYTDKGHAFYVLTFPHQATIVYDAATTLWHERQTFQRNDWAVIGYEQVYDRHVTGSFTSGKLYVIDRSVRTDDGVTVRRQAVSASLWAETTRATMSRFEVDFETGVGITDGQGEDPQAMLDFSDDGGKTWSNEKWTTLGRIGTYRTRAQWRRLGQFRQRNIRVTVSDPVFVAIHGAYADMEGGYV